MQNDEFRVVFDEFSHLLRRYIIFKVKDEASAEDILQEVFVSLYKNGSSIRSRDKLKSWLYAVAKNAIINHIRTKKSTEILRDDIAQTQENDSLYRELSECVKHFASTLPSTYSEVITLYEFEELSANEIANKLSMPIATVKSKVQRGRKKLKEALFACCEFEFDLHGAPIDFRPKCCKTPSCLKK